MSQSAHRGELRRLIKEFVALENADELSVDDISKFLFKDHLKLVQLEKTRLFHNAIADIARDVLKSPQASQQLMLPGFPADAHLPARVPIKSRTKDGKPIWIKPLSMSGKEIHERILELSRPARTSGALKAMRFLMDGMKSKLGAAAKSTPKTYEEVMDLTKPDEETGDR
jgi:hypothetical protein